MKGAIYQIVNIVTGKAYIGSSVSIKMRWKRHKRSLELNQHHSVLLQRSWNKYGKENFRFQIIEECVATELLDVEQGYLDWSFGNNVSLNVLRVAGRTTGYKHDEDTRRKMSKIQKEYWKNNPEKIKRGESHHNYGKETAEHIKEVISKTHAGKNNYNYGKEYNKEERENLKSKLAGENSPCSKLTWLQVREMREEYPKGGTTHAQLAKRYGVSTQTIQCVLENKTWKSDEYDYKPHNLQNSGENSNAKLVWGDIEKIRERYRGGDKCSEIAKDYNMKYSAIRKIVTNKTWRYRC